MKHLSYKIYLTILACLLAVVLVSGVFWRRAGDPLPARHAFEVAGELAGLALAPPDAGAEAQAESVRRLAERLRLDLALFTAARAPIAASGKPLPPPPEDKEDGGWMHGRGGPAWAIALPDGRWLVARAPRRGRFHPAIRFIAFLGTIAAVIALLAWPVARGLTRRLERLQLGVETLGSGDLTARVAVRGRDEVARLAESFNRAAARIENLVRAQKMLLANASHELRTPLSRIRMGLELMGDGAAPARKAALETDIAELDDLIDEILLMSRLDAVASLEAREEIDLLALAAEETARYDDASVGGERVAVEGDARLLRRLVRNLLENARRHGRPPIEVEIGRDGDGAVLTVTDHGPGVAPGDRERVFEPFARGTHGAGPGFGVGLALVRQIARRHGGEAGVADTGASRILVTLPARL